jgi:hypothetical protein
MRLIAFPKSGMRQYQRRYWIVVWLVLFVAFALSYPSGRDDAWRANQWLWGGIGVATLIAASFRGKDEKAQGGSAFAGFIIGWLILVPLLFLAAFLGLMVGWGSTQ